MAELTQWIVISPTGSLEYTRADTREEAIAKFEATIKNGRKFENLKRKAICERSGRRYTRKEFYRCAKTTSRHYKSVPRKWTSDPL